MSDSLKALRAELRSLFVKQCDDANIKSKIRASAGNPVRPEEIEEFIDACVDGQIEVFMRWEGSDVEIFQELQRFEHARSNR